MAALIFLRSLLNDAAKQNSLLLFLFFRRSCVSCNYPRIWNSKNSCWGRKASWRVCKHRPGIRLVVQRKSKKSLGLFESLWQWL